MNKFEITSSCSGCGLCYNETDLILEDNQGYAFAKQGELIEQSFLAKAREIANDCPSNAINIVTVKSKSKEEILKDLKTRLNSVGKVKITREMFKIDPHKYDMTYGNVGWCDYTYRSESQAERAGLDEFNRIAFSQYDSMILSVFVQYKNDKLRHYYTDDGTGFYDTQNKKYISILKEAEAELKAQGVNVPSGFSDFNVMPKESFMSTKELLKLLSEFEQHSNGSGVMSEYRSGSYSTLQSYDMYIDTDDMDYYEEKGGFFGGSKEVTKYRYDPASVIKAANEFAKDLKDAMKHVDIDEHAMGQVEIVVTAYYKCVDAEINNKLKLIK